MSDTMATSTRGIGEASQRLPEWIAKNVVGLVVTAAISGVVGYLVNVWLMAVRYEGSVSPEGAPAMSKDNVIAGGIFWALFPMVVCSAIGYRRAVGKERFWRDVRRLPITLVSLFRRDGSGGWVHLLWGAAIALAATLVVPPAVGAVLGVGLLVGAPTIVGSVLSSAFAQLWRLIGRVVNPSKDHRVAPILKVAVGILGWAAALIIGFVLPGEWIRLVLAVGCAGVAIFLGRRGAAGPAVAAAVALVVVALGWFVVEVLTASAALADDGGFAECGSNLETWLRNCAGAGEVRRRAVLGAVVASPAGLIGFVSGGLVGGVAALSGGGPWWDRLGLEELPGGAVDPVTGESLVVNDGRWTDVPVGHVYFQGQWAHPEAVGAVPEVGEDPFSPDEEDPSFRPELWVPPLVAAILAGATSGAGSDASSTRRRSARRADAAAEAATAAAASGEAAPTDPTAAAPSTSSASSAATGLLAEAEAIRSELAGVDEASEPQRHEALRTSLKTKAVQIAEHPEARVLAAADRTGLGDALTTALHERDTEVEGVFVERLNELGVQRGGRPVGTDDIAELRARNQPDVAPAGMRQLWKGYGSKKGKFAIDAATYLRFLEDKRERNDPPLTDEDREKLDRRIERLRRAVDDGVDTVMVSEQIWNEVAQHAYALASAQPSA